MEPTLDSHGILKREGQKLPTSAAAQALGGRWLSNQAELAMKVPSAIIPEEFNIIINPQHPGYANVSLSVVRRFTSGTRMFK